MVSCTVKAGKIISQRRYKYSRDNLSTYFGGPSRKDVRCSQSYGPLLAIDYLGYVPK